MTKSSLTLQDYQLAHPIGRGNTSQVRLAKDPQGKEVAVKIPLPGTLDAHDAAERFGNEVRLTMKFHHPHIIRGYAGTAFGPEAFLALQYYPGGSLSDQMARQDIELSRDDKLRILADIASALTYMHKIGAVHQDVKPQNVYVAGGRAALGDLGSAYFVAQGGKVSGSPYYMAPEIYHGESSSAASDVYSLAIMSYELLTGQRPFQGSSYEQLMVAHLTRFPAPLSHHCPDLPRTLSRLTDQAMAKRASDRPSSDALRRALLEALGEVPQDEEVTDAEASASAPPAVRQAGRHTTAAAPPPAAPPAAPSPAKEKDPPVRGWNPFKRKK